MKSIFDKVYFKLIIVVLLLISLWTGASTDIVNAYPTPVAGFGNALDFSANRIDIPSNDATRLAGNSDFTVSMWIFPEAEAGCKTLYRQSGESDTLGVWLRYEYDGSNGYLYYGFDKFGDVWQWAWSPWNNVPEEITKFPLNQWTHVALAKSGHSVKIYINGVEDYAMTLDAVHFGTPAPSTGGISVGGDSIKVSDNFDGRIDEIRFWNTGLTANVISDWMYRGIDSTHPNYEDLVFYYKLNQSSGAEVTDSKGTNHGTAISITDSNWVTSDIRGWTVNAGTTLSGKLVGSYDNGASTNGSDWNLAFEIETQGSKGTAAVTEDNQFTYTVDIDQEGSDSFTYKVQDPSLNYSNVQTVNINIIPAKTISGNAGVAGAVLSYNDGSDKTVTADGSGDYSILVPSNWSGTVTPSKTGYTFTPANKVYTNVLDDQTVQDYTAAVSTYSIASISDQTMTAMTAGYGAGIQETKTVTITRTGTGDLVDLAVDLSGANADNFELTQPLVTTLNDGTPSTTFTVKAKDGLAAGTYTATVTVSADNLTDETFTVTQVVNPPSAPVIQSAAAGDSHISIVWNSVAGASGYKIFQSTTSDSYGAAIATVGSDVHSYDATGLTNGTTYYFVVRTVAGSSESVNSNEMSAIPQVAAPGAPVLLSAVAGDGHVNITWDAVSGSTGYKLYASTTSGSYTTPAATVAESVYSCDVTGLTNGTAYYFVVTASNPGGDSGYSNEISAIPQVSAPSAPTGVTPVSGNAKVTLSWDSTAGATGYKIYQSTTSGSYGPALATVAGDVYSYEVAGLTNGVVYYFVVQAVNAGGDSPNSAEVNAMPGTVPGAPTNVAAMAGNGQAAVSFTPPADNGGSSITGYTVTSSPGNITATGTGTTITVTGLTNGTVYTFTVTASNAFGTGPASAASNAATPYRPSEGSDDSSTSDSPAQPAYSGVDIFVNGETETAATATTTQEGDKTVTTIVVDDEKMEKRLEQVGNNAVVTIPVNNGAHVVVGTLNGQTVKNMENIEAVLEIKTGQVTYTLPASQINIDTVSEQIGKQTELKDIAVSVKISEPAADTVKIVEDTADKNNYQLMVRPIEFEMTCSSGNKAVEVSKFNIYVERMIALPEGVDPSRITTGVILNSDGTFSHVPTTIVEIDGRYYAKINSLTNSIYSVIWNIKTFVDIENHWARDAVVDMGSRLVINDLSDDKFEPDRDITRAEFAGIVVKALGLMRSGMGKDVFSDVPEDTWYYDAVSIANEYGLVSGYGDEVFRPNDRISREQAMAIISRAMKIAGLKADLTEDETRSLLKAFKDAGMSADYARNDIAACIEAGIISGRNGTLLAPKDNLTKAEAAVIVRRLLQISSLI